MSINSVRFPEGKLVSSNDPLDLFLTKLTIEQTIERLEPGEYDLTPESWRNVFHTVLHVQDQDRAVLLGDPQCLGVGIEPFSVCIPKEEDLTMMMVHNPDGSNTRLLGAVFHLPEYSDNELL